MCFGSSSALLLSLRVDKLDMTHRERPQRDARPLTLETALEKLYASRPDVADEIQALQAIFGDEKIRLHASGTVDDSWTPEQTCVALSHHSLPCTCLSALPCLTACPDRLRLALDTTLPSTEDVDIELIVSLRPEYPATLPPQLQLAGKVKRSLCPWEDVEQEPTSS